jgi:3-hydroxyisobutyrate dehydrogenase
VKALTDAGAVFARSLEGELIPQCSTFISMVPSSSHVMELYKSSIIPTLKGRSSLFIDCSTIDPTTARAVSQFAESEGHLMVDAPVSGGIKGAENGTLTFMVGSSLSESDFNIAVKPNFKPMGNPIYCGGPGVGQSVKVCNNLILGAQMLGVAEGYRLAQHLGVDLKKFNQIVNSSTGHCWTTEKYNPVPGLMEGVPASRNYQGGFMTDLMIKDLGLAIDSAADCPLPVTEFARSEYRKISGAGKGSLDFGYCFKMYDDKNGDKI